MTWGLLLGAAAPALGICSPFLPAADRARHKVLRALRERMGPNGRHIATRDLSRSAVMIHAVSLGEINATRALVAQLAKARPDLQFVVSTTTDTGFARGRELYGSNPDVTLVRYPLDFSAAIGRLFDRLRPDMVVLMELEVWPNFVYQCDRRGVPVVLVNGRLTSSSFGGYRRARPLVARMFRRLRLVCAQDPVYAERFVALGAPADRVRVTGTMKFDTAQVADRIPGDADLAAAVGLPTHDVSSPVWVCGSTGPGEEEIILRAYRDLLAAHPGLRLVLIPRHKERFDAVADLVRREEFGLVRRSQSSIPNLVSHIPDFKSPPVVLGDTIGELPKFYSLADVAFVGRSLVDLGPRQHGSDMIEAAALAKPVVVGPWTHNFAEPMNRLREADAVRVAADAAGLRRHLSALLSDPAAAADVGRRAQAVVRREQGATARHVEVILQALAAVAPAGAGPLYAGNSRAVLQRIHRE